MKKKVFDIFKGSESLNLICMTCGLFVAVSAISCRKAVQVDPPVNSLVTANVYSNNASAAAAITAIYINMIKTTTFFGGGNYGCSAVLGLSADEFKYYGTDALGTQVYTNAQLSTDPPLIWTPLYNYIYQANDALAGLTGSSGVSAALKRQLIGEAEFIRALCYFYLVNIYGDVPLVLTTNYQTNAIIARTPSAQVYQQVITDLKNAQSELSTNFVDQNGNVTQERTRPNSWTATALLARTYLYTHDWSNSELQATAIINDSAEYRLLPNLDNVFLKNNNEAIWQLEAINPPFDTYDGLYFILSGDPTGTQAYVISQNLMNSFEAGDSRETNWINGDTVGTTIYYYPYKYKMYYGSITEYLTVFRLAEQYLIRAEARAQQNNLAGSIADLNIIRKRAGLNGLNPSTQNSLLSAILHERQVELFTEWGHRWLDLKRTGSVDSVMSIATSQKGGAWTGTSQLYPIPQSEILLDINLVQNPGYQ